MVGVGYRWAQGMNLRVVGIVFLAFRTESLWYAADMNLTLPDDPALAEFGAAELRLDLACGLYFAGRISRDVAARVAGLERDRFDQELFDRGIPAYTEDMLQEDVAALNMLFPK